MGKPPRGSLPHCSWASLPEAVCHTVHGQASQKQFTTLFLCKPSRGSLSHCSWASLPEAVNHTVPGQASQRQLTTLFLGKPPRSSLPHCSCGSFPEAVYGYLQLCMHTFPINQQLLFLIRWKRKNGGRNIFTIKSS